MTPISKGSEKKEKTILLIVIRKKKRLFKLQPSQARRQLNGKKEAINSKFRIDKMLENVQSL